MPFALDTDKLNSADLKMMDIGNPPVKSIAHEEFPKMVYLHPKDKTAEHRTKVVEDRDELEKAQAVGYRLTPHVPEPKPDASLEGFEYEAPEPARRGPGRPKSEA